ncbi:MAG: hypothetical protein JETCAE03_33660 [Ignavibacteriaceae bacterium]|jgi:hypothetical protein|nr:MAG: hypothetical protein JETCAE03_33660 [Ignavibacteriaceae bacterium]
MDNLGEKMKKSDLRNGYEVKLNDINRIPELCKYLTKELKKSGQIK